MTRVTEELEAVEELKPYAYFKQQIVSHAHHFYISDAVGDPLLYVDMIHTIRSGGTDEVMVIHLNTVGGNLATGVQIINAIEASQSHIICIVEGECHSLGTLIFLSADEFVVHDHCLMMFHNYSGGTFGKGHEQMSQIDATQKWFSSLAQQLYIPFMSEEEFQSIIDGKDLWIQSDEIRERLNNMVKLIELETAEATEEDAPVTATKKKKSSSKAS